MKRRVITIGAVLVLIGAVLVLLSKLFSGVSAAAHRKGCDIIYADTNVVIFTQRAGMAIASEILCFNIISRHITWKCTTNSLAHAAIQDKGSLYYFEYSGSDDYYMVSRNVNDGTIKWKTRIPDNAAYKNETVNSHDISFPILNGDNIVVFRKAVERFFDFGEIKYFDYMRYDVMTGNLMSITNGCYCGYTTNTVLINDWDKDRIICLGNGITNQISNRDYSTLRLETCNLPDTHDEVPVQLTADNKTIVYSANEGEVYIYDDVSNRFETYSFSKQKNYQIRYVLLTDCFLRYAEMVRDNTTDDNLWIESYDYTNNLISRIEFANSGKEYGDWLHYCIRSTNGDVGFVHGGKCHLLEIPSLKEITSFDTYNPDNAFISYYKSMNSQLLLQSVNVHSRRSGDKSRLIMYNIPDGSIYYEHVIE